MSATYTASEQLINLNKQQNVMNHIQEVNELISKSSTNPILLESLQDFKKMLQSELKILIRGIY